MVKIRYELILLCGVISLESHSPLLALNKELDVTLSVCDGKESWKREDVIVQIHLMREE